MADTFLFTNNAVSTLASGINDTDGTIFLNTGDGAKFPSPVAGQVFPATLTNAAGDIEIVYCTGRSADTLTVNRNQELSGAKSWLAGDVIELRITAGVLSNILQGDNQVIALSNADMVDGLDASATAEANKLLALDAGSILQATVANALLLGGSDLAYVLSRGNHTGFVTEDDLSGRIGSELFAANGTFNVPNGISQVVTIMVGGGGGGGGGGGAAYYDPGYNRGEGGAGGRAGQIKTDVHVVTPGANIAVNVGAGGGGGAGGTSGSTGSAGTGSSFGAIGANGGAGGVGGIQPSDSGTSPIRSTQMRNGKHGESSPFGYGGAGGNYGTPPVAGGIGSAGAGGGGGGSYNFDGSGAAGGDGGTGMVLVLW